MLMYATNCPKCKGLGLMWNKCTVCGAKFCMSCGKEIKTINDLCDECTEKHWGDLLDNYDACEVCGIITEPGKRHCTARTCKQCCADGKCRYEEKCNHG